MDIMQVFFVWLFLLFVVFTTTMLLIGQHEEILRKDTNSNSTKNITKYVIGWCDGGEVGGGISKKWIL